MLRVGAFKFDDHAATRVSEKLQYPVPCILSDLDSGD